MRGDILDRSTGSENRVSRHQDKMLPLCGKHVPQACKVKFERCFRCGKTGYIANSKVCKGKPRLRSGTEESCDERDDHFMAYNTHTVDALKNLALQYLMCIAGTKFDMQLDTAADVSLLPESLYRKHLSHLPLLPAGIVLKTYENQTVNLAGKIIVNVQYDDHEVNLPLIIVKSADKAALFGLQWLEHNQVGRTGQVGADEGEIYSGKCVYVKNFWRGLKWLIGTIIHVTGPVSYAIALQEEERVEDT